MRLLRPEIYVEFTDGMARMLASGPIFEMKHTRTEGRDTEVLCNSFRPVQPHWLQSQPIMLKA